MPDNTLYVIDTSSAIDFNRHYNHPVFKSLNDDFNRLIRHGRLIAPYQVLAEIELQDDLCAQWAHSHERRLFRFDYSDFTMQKLAEIMSNFPGLVNVESEKDQADPYLIALALEARDGSQERFVEYDNVCVLTQERLHGNRVKIPFVCQSYGLLCCSLLQMFTQEGWEY
ncbi:MAG: DUF4411 family protein [Methanocella sp.]